MKAPAPPDTASLAPASDGARSRDWLADGELIAGKYRLVRKLGRGAMGSVWEATHLALETPVAVKFLTWDATASSSQIETASASSDSSSQKRQDARARFEREAKAAAQIRSANVVQVFDYGVDRAVPFIVMELLSGEDLNKRLQREGRLSPAATARLVQAISRALQRAHDLGLVHRDLKPGNIFLAREGEHEVPKVVDFGVVKAMGEEHRLATDGSENTMEGTLIGTPSYMSPEQAMGRTDIDHRSDLWSVSVILFQVLTGMKPFPGGNLFEALVRICSDPVPRPSTIAPDLPKGTDAFFERALERDIGKRFQSARELERAFYALISRPSASVPPDALDALSAMESSPDLMPEITVSTGLTVAPGARRRGLVLGVAAVGAIVVLGTVAAFALKGKPERPVAPATPEAIAKPGAPATTAEPSSEPASVTAAAATATASAGTTATASATPTTAATPAPRPHPVSVQPAGPTHKPKRDLGY
jgi:serine/threonine-protein kinase